MATQTHSALLAALLDSNAIRQQFKTKADFLASCEAWWMSRFELALETQSSNVPGAEDIYAAYPKKVGKPAALRAIKKALAGVSAERLLRKTIHFAECWKGKPLDFCPHPATWFNQARYNDDPTTYLPKPISEATRSKMLSAQLKAIEQLIHDHPANPTSLKYKSPTPDQKAELAVLRHRLDETRRKLVSLQVV